MPRTPKKSKQKKPQRRHAWIILTAFIGFLTYVYIGGEFGLWQHWKLLQQRNSLEQEILNLQMRQDSLRMVVEKLQADSAYIAKIAREKYNMGLPSEEIIRILRKDGNSAK